MAETLAKKLVSRHVGASMPNLGSLEYPDIGTAGAIAVEGGFRREHVKSRRGPSNTLRHDADNASQSPRPEQLQRASSDSTLDLRVTKASNVANRQGSLVSNGRFRLAVKPPWPRPSPRRHSRGFEVRVVPSVSPRLLSPAKDCDGSSPSSVATHSLDECLDQMIDTAAPMTCALDAVTRHSLALTSRTHPMMMPENMSCEKRRSLLLDALAAQKELLLVEKEALVATNAAIRRFLQP